MTDRMIATKLNQMYNKYSLLAILVLLISMLLFDCVNGQVLIIKDQTTGLTIEGVVVRTVNSELLLTSDYRGRVDLGGVSKEEKIDIYVPGHNEISLTYEDLAKLNFIVYIESRAIGLEEVVVTATRWSQPNRLTPAKVVRIAQTERKSLQPQTAADLLGMNADVFIQKSQQGGGSPMIRGFASNRLLYIVDGIRMNNAIFRAGNLHNVISLDPYTIEWTEVRFGPSSVQYGSDAIGGVMYFESLKNSFSNSKKMLATGYLESRISSANSENTQHGHLKLSNDRWAILLSYSRMEYGDARMGSFGPEDYLRPFFVRRVDGRDSIIANRDPRIQTPSGYKQHYSTQKIAYRPKRNLVLEMVSHWSDINGFARYDRLIEVNAAGIPRSAEWNYGPQKWNMQMIKVGYAEGNLVFDRADFRVARQYFQESRIDRPFSGGNRFRRRTQKEEIVSWTAQADFIKFFDNWQIRYGSEFIYNDIESKGSGMDIRDSSLIPVPDRYPQSKWLSAGIYLSADLNISKKWYFQSGIRYQIFDLKSDFNRHLEFYPFDFTTTGLFNGQLSGNVGITGNLSEKWRVALNSGMGFRAPNVDDIGKLFDFASGEVVVPNGNLKPETAYNIELNISHKITKRIKWDVSMYYTYLDRAMVRRRFQVQGQDSILFNGIMSQVYAIQNAAYGQVYGIQLSMDCPLSRSLSILAKYNWQLGTEEMDDGSLSRSRHAAPPFGMIRLIYILGRMETMLSFWHCAAVTYDNLNEEERQNPAIYAKDANGLPWSPSWQRIDFRLNFRMSDKIRISGGIENVLDARYRPYSSGISALGRNYYLSVGVGW